MLILVDDDDNTATIPTGWKVEEATNGNVITIYLDYDTKIIYLPPGWENATK